MEALSSWLQRPLTEGSTLKIWMAAAAGMALLLLLILILILLKRRKRTRSRVPAPITEEPSPMPVLELSNLQGIGAREDQQDAFAISPIDQYDQDGLLMVLCDGMGGMAEGGRIANETADELLQVFPWEDHHDVVKWVTEQSRSVYRRFRGQGGTTLVAALIQEGNLFFWCVGDSDLFLLREGVLYSLHNSQDYRNELVLKALSGAFPVEDAFLDVQAGALSEYIGKEHVNCAYTRIPLKLQPEDALLLASDGVSNTLSLAKIRETLAFSPLSASKKLEEEILAAENQSQDNFTAIILKYHGRRVSNGHEQTQK